jgi:hypothetical protein
VAGDDSFALVYVPDDMPVWVDLNRLHGDAVDAEWFDPVTGAQTFDGRHYEKAITRFHWEANPGERDHVLVLRAASPFAGAGGGGGRRRSRTGAPASARPVAARPVAEPPRAE